MTLSPGTKPTSYISSDWTPPVELTDDVVIMDFKVPSFAELFEIYDNLIKAQAARKRPVPNFSEDDVDAVIVSGMGLTANEFESALSRAIVINAKNIANVDVDKFRSVILAIKTEAVKKSEVLEVMEGAKIEEIGGLENMKIWVGKRKNVFTPEAREFGIDPLKGCMIVGPPGCVDGETIVGYRRGRRNSFRPIVVRELYRKISGIKTSSRSWSQCVFDFASERQFMYGRTHYARLVIEAGMNNLPVTELIHILKTDKTRSHTSAFRRVCIHWCSTVCWSNPWTTRSDTSLRIVAMQNSCA